MSPSNTPSDPESMPWHRLFGLILMDYFTNTPYEVQIEMDLSTQQQRVDVIILRVTDQPLEIALPDGLQDLAQYNLISFKSHRDTLEDWTLHELIGHYVSYRKSISPKPGKKSLLDMECFHLYAMSARYPEGLFKEITPTKIQEGVYEWYVGKLRIRIVVLNQLPLQADNALFHLFTAVPDLVEYGRENYQQHSPQTSSLLQRLLTEYGQENLGMPYTMEDFKRELKQSVLKELTPEERLKGLSPEVLREAIPPAERVKDISPEEIMTILSKEQIEALARQFREQAQKESGDDFEPDAAST